jgi:HPt (histidine-containing phosphotransfer) domain-containing protein
MSISGARRVVPDGPEMDLDRSAFDNLVAEIGREDTLQTFSIFFAEADDRLKRLRMLSCEAERNAVAEEAHGLKGSAANFGLRQVSQLAALLERDAPTVTATAYEVALRVLEASYTAARKHFAKLTS